MGIRIFPGKCFWEVFGVKSCFWELSGRFLGSFWENPFAVFEGADKN